MIQTLLVLTCSGLIWALVVAVKIRSWGFFFRSIVFPTAIGTIAWMIGFLIARIQHPSSFTGHEGIIILSVASFYAYLGVTATLALNLIYPILNMKGRIEMKSTMPHVFRITRVMGFILCGCFATVVIGWIFDR